MIRQVVNQSKKQNDKVQYDHDSQRLLEALAKRAATERFAKVVNPYPLAHSQEELEIQMKIQQLLCKAINGVVGNYFTDKRIQEIIKLDNRTIELLKYASRQPYEIGAFRPDFLYDMDGNIVICEINARFSTNAFFITDYLRACEWQKSDSDGNGIQLRQYSENVVEAFLGRIPEENTVYIVKGRERGWDIYCLANELENFGRSCAIISPSDLGKVVPEENTTFILELHQDEILQDGVYEAICALSQTRNYFNDLRTIFIAHDKRMLAVLHRQDIMEGYISTEDYKFLCKHIAKTFVLSTDEAKQEACHEKNNWIKKPATFGKGEGILLGRHLSQVAWEQAIDCADEGQYVLQEVVSQEQTEVVTMIEQNVCSCYMNIVGTMLCMDKDYLGPGVYRASEDDIVNVASGGVILFPVLAILPEVRQQTEASLTASAK